MPSNQSDQCGSIARSSGVSAGAAAQTVDKLENLLGWGATATGYSNEEIKGFVKSGNKLILDDIWGDLQGLYNGPPVKGAAAFNWDAKQLLKEQMVINDSYWGLAGASLSILENSVKKNGFLPKFFSGPSFSGSILNVNDRWVYGMTTMGYQVQVKDVPIPASCPQSFKNR